MLSQFNSSATNGGYPGCRTSADAVPDMEAARCGVHTRVGLDTPEVAPSMPLLCEETGRKGALVLGEEIIVDKAVLNNMRGDYCEAPLGVLPIGYSKALAVMQFREELRS